MKTPFFIVLIFCLALLSACGKTTENTTTENEQKQIFTIKTTKLGNFATDISKEKTAIIRANSSLSVPAETSGKIAKIFVKE